MISRRQKTSINSIKSQRSNAARPQGWVGCGRRAGRAQSRLHQHRVVQRRMAAPLPGLYRHLPHQSDPDRNGRTQLGLLESHRAENAQYGALPAGGRQAGLSEGRSRQRYAIAGDHPAPRSWQDRVRRKLRALSLEQAAGTGRWHAIAEQWSEGLQGAELSRVLERILAVDQVRRLQAADGGDRSRTIFWTKISSPPNFAFR